MAKASSVAPPPVRPRPLDPSIARRSLAIIEGIEAPEMSDAEAMAGIDFARLVGFPIDDLPDDGDPHKAAKFFAALGLAPDFTGMNFNAAEHREEEGEREAAESVDGQAAADSPDDMSAAQTGVDGGNVAEGDGDPDALAFLKGAKG